MKVIGVIPARYNSSRFRGKPLADICGKPMVWWVYNQAKKANGLFEIYVATDDERIKKVCTELDIPVLMTSTEHKTPTDRIYEVSTILSGDLFVCINGDEPLIDPFIIENIIPSHIETGEYVTNIITTIKDPAEVVDFTNLKVVTDELGNGVYISRSPIPYPKGSMNIKYKKHIGVVAFTPESLEFYHKTKRGQLENVEDIDLLRYIENHKNVKFIDVECETLSVDTPKDLEMVIEIIQQEEAFNMIKDFKRKIEKETAFGLFMKTSDPSFVEIAGLSGFDFVILDDEHGVAGYDNIQNLVRAAKLSNTMPIIRVANNHENNISKALDIGAGGIQVPQVRNSGDANKAISSSKFFPFGERGVCRFVRAANFSLMDRNEYFENANQSLVILQLEGKESIANLEEILNVNGVDIVFIGPYDLSQSLGLPGEIFNPAVLDEMNKIVNRCKELGVYVGTFVDTIDGARYWEDAGVKYIAYSVDTGIFANASREILKVLRKES